MVRRKIDKAILYLGKRKDVAKNLSKYTPNPLSRMANLIAWDYGLSPDTALRWLKMFVDVGLLIQDRKELFELYVTAESS